MLEEKTTKKQNFLAGAAVLSLATMIVKVIGMFFKIPLNRLIGEATTAISPRPMTSTPCCL